MNRQQSKALIIGGGIAGPVAALLLQRAGIEAEIYEERDTPEDYASSWLILACNGLAVLKTLGLADHISADGSPIPHMILSSGKGRRFGEVPNGARPEVGAPSLVVKRGTLNRMLREEAIRRGIKVSFGKKLHGIEMTDDQGVIATFANGTTAEGTFLLGCDGIHSRTRQLINPDAPSPQYTGMMSTGGFAHSLQLPATPDTLHLVFGKQAFIGYHISSSGEISWFVTFPQSQEPERSEVNQIGSDEWHQYMLDCLRDIPEREQAFVTYERLRRERVERVVQYARSLGTWRVMTNPIQARFWELLMPVFLKRSANPTALDWLYSYQVDWDAPVVKPPDPMERESMVNPKQLG